MQGGEVRLDAALVSVSAPPSVKPSPARKRAKKVSCEDCFFKRNMLCSVSGEPCATFRPYDPEGLRPPPQLRFVFRQEARTRVAWTFPSAQEQAALRN